MVTTLGSSHSASTTWLEISGWEARGRRDRDILVIEDNGFMDRPRSQAVQGASEGETYPLRLPSRSRYSCPHIRLDSGRLEGVVCQPIDRKRVHSTDAITLNRLEIPILG
jgi:hypothetical protein